MSNRRPFPSAVQIAERLSLPADALSLLGVGEWSKAYKFMAGGSTFVARLGRHVADYYKDQAVGERLGSLLGVPKVIRVERFDDCFSLCVSTYMQGVPVHRLRVNVETCADALFEAVQVVQAAGAALLVEVNDMFTGDWSQYILDIGNPQGESRLDGWHRQMERMPALGRIFSRGCQTLRTSFENTPFEPVLIHADLLHGNALFDAAVQKLGVIDWGSAAIGDGLYEYANLYYWADRLYVKNPDMASVLLSRINRVVACDGDYPSQWTLYLLHVGLQQMRFNFFARRDAALGTHASQVEKMRMALERDS